MSFNESNQKLQFLRMKTNFEDLLKDTEDLYCTEHSKLKTIYTDKHPNNPEKGGFICDYCPNPSSTMKFYSQILAENASVINQIKNSSPTDATNGVYLDFVEKCNEYNILIEQSSSEINTLTTNFDSSFIPSMYTKLGASDELNKLRQIIKTISFNAQGRPIYDSIGRDPEREKLYVKLANILMAFKGQDFDIKTGFSPLLKNYLTHLCLKRLEFIRRSNAYLQFLIGDFYDVCFKIDNLEPDREFLKTLDLIIYDQEEFNNHTSSLHATINNHNTTIINLQERIAHLERELKNLKDSYDLLSIEYNDLEKHNQEFQEQMNMNIVSSQNDQEGFERTITLIKLDCDAQIKEWTLKNDELFQALEKANVDVMNLNSKYNILYNEHLNFQNIHNSTVEDYERRMSNLTLNYNNLKLEYEQSLIRLAEIEELKIGLQEALISRKNLSDVYAEEKGNWIMRRNQYEYELENLRKTLNSNILCEASNVELNSKLSEFSLMMKNLEARLDAEMKLTQSLRIEKEDIYAKMQNYIIENNSLTLRFKSLNDDYSRISDATSLNASLLSDLKKQIAINQTLNLTIENLQDKINVYNSRVAANELLIRNQLEIIKRYTEDKPTISFEEKTELLFQTRRETELIIARIEKIESNPLYRSINMPVQESGVESYIRNNFTSSSDPLSKSVIYSTENFTNNSTTTFKMPLFRPTRIIYKINFSNELLLNNSNWDIIRDWIEETNLFINGIQPKILFKSTRDGFKAKEFQKRCLNVPNTLVLAKTNFDKVIGAFTPLPWNFPEEGFNYFKDLTNSTFLFSVTDGEKLPIKPNADAVCVSKSHGPIFGGGSDFEIVDDCDSKYNQVSNIGHSFIYSNTAYDFFGSDKYLISEYEVYQII